jgi:hypothetical protein
LPTKIADAIDAADAAYKRRRGERCVVERAPSCESARHRELETSVFCDAGRSRIRN